jgi:hypothetical protein
VEADCSLSLIHVLHTKIEEKWRSVMCTSPLNLILGAQPRTPVEGAEAVEVLRQMRMLVRRKSQ